MNDRKQRFIDELLAADAPSANARKHYEEQMRSMIETRLTAGKRREYLAVFVLFGLLSSVCAAICGSSLLTGWPRLPENADSTFVLTFFLLMSMALFAVAAISFRAFQRETIQRRIVSPWAARAGMAYVGAMGCLLLLMASRTPGNIREDVRIVGLILIGLGMVAWVRHSLWGAEMRTTEKLLEIELRVAEIGEALENQRTPAPPASTHVPPSV